MAKELFADYVKEKKLREPEEKKELAQTLKTCYVEARKKGFVQCVIKQLLFWISQKPHPIIVYKRLLAGQFISPFFST